MRASVMAQRQKQQLEINRRTSRKAGLRPGDNRTSPVHDGEKHRGDIGAISTPEIKE